MTTKTAAERGGVDGEHARRRDADAARRRKLGLGGNTASITAITNFIGRRASKAEHQRVLQDGDDEVMYR